jgi:hypothetical protein
VYHRGHGALLPCTEWSSRTIHQGLYGQNGPRRYEQGRCGECTPSDSVGNLPQLGLNRLLDGFSTRGATAVCTFAYCPGPGMEPVLFEGKTEGTIVPARGSTHFGWDAVFQPIGTSLTSVGSTYVVRFCFLTVRLPRVGMQRWIPPIKTSSPTGTRHLIC